MNNNVMKTDVNLDGLHSLIVSVNESRKTVVAELVVADEEPILIYAEKFDSSCNYLKTAIKKGIIYINNSSDNPYKKNCSYKC